MIRAVLLDWGDTVMRVFPEYSGPMAYWPTVEAVPGVTQALTASSLHYRLILVTNASDSDTALVRSALHRVNLEKYFTNVFTSIELGARKPDPVFYNAVLSKCGYPAGEAVMVGDDYTADVIGAKEVGLQTVWYNPSGSPCPTKNSIHDVEIQSMAELPDILGNISSQKNNGF